MAKILYVRIPDELHDYVTELAEESKLPVARVVEAILSRARADGVSVTARAE
jgi:hypothetical protein